MPEYPQPEGEAQFTQVDENGDVVTPTEERFPLNQGSVDAINRHQLPMEHEGIMTTQEAIDARMTEENRYDLVAHPPSPEEWDIVRDIRRRNTPDRIDSPHLRANEERAIQAHRFRRAHPEAGPSKYDTEPVAPTTPTAPETPDPTELFPDAPPEGPEA